MKFGSVLHTWHWLRQASRIWVQRRGMLIRAEGRTSRNWARRVSEIKVLEHEQFKVAERLGLGSPRIGDIDLRVSNMTEDGGFQDVVNGIREELGQPMR